MVKISFICSDIEHPIYPVLDDWVKGQRGRYDIELVSSAKCLRAKGDFLFLISCSELIISSIRNRFLHTLVLHASDLPRGKGWSPHVWQIIEGLSAFTLTLLEAEDKIDSGRIWLKKVINIRPDELYNEINDKLFAAELELIETAITQRHSIEPQAQNISVPVTYYRKRTPEDSRLDISDSIEHQFNLLRVSDSERYPAFFDYCGQRFALKLEKIGRVDEEQ